MLPPQVIHSRLSHSTVRLLLPILALLACASPLLAATFNVPSQYSTIQTAVNAAQSGDTVLVADGTYSGDGNRDIDFGGKSLTVTSQHGAASTIIDCGGSSSAYHRGFYLHSSETNAVIRGLTVKNGYTIFTSDDSDSGDGGGICVINSSVAIQNCVFTNNTASDGGGVFSIDGNVGTITLADCTVSNNTAGLGGGIIDISSNGGAITLTNCDVIGNNSQTAGGVYNYNQISNSSSVIKLTGCTITGNTAHNIGGVYNSNDNSDAADVGGTIILTNCMITGNTAQVGVGGVENSNGNSVGIGATNFNNSDTISLIGCTISGNTAHDIGGISNLNSTIVGGSFVYHAAIRLTNCTITGNTATNLVGGVANQNDNSNNVLDGMITLANCTVTDNTAQQGGGVSITNTNGSTIILTNDIVYGDTGGEVYSNGGYIAAASFSDIQGRYVGTGNINADPLFVNAPSDLHLRAGSPCLGAGTSTGAPTTDKDGKTRPNPPSIGAYEMATSHTHLLWNNSDARVMLWSVAADGSFTLHGFGPYTDNAPGNVWHATAVATGPDGRSHLLWNNTDGRVMLWTVDDAGTFTLAGYGPYTDGAPQNKWSATAVSVGPDNTVHLLWNNTDHRVMLWNVSSDFSFTLAGYGPYTDNSVSSDPGNLWSATALATGPDNLSRIAWNNADGRVMLWDVNPDFTFTLAGYGPYTDGAAQNKWSAVGVSIGPDNLTHLLWGNTDRRAMFWNVAPDFSFTLAGYGPYTDNGANNLWSAQSVATGPDGLSHILWGNTDYRAMLWGVDNSFNFTVAGYGPYTDNAPGNLWSVTAVSAGP